MEHLVEDQAEETKTPIMREIKHAVLRLNAEGKIQVIRCTL